MVKTVSEKIPNISVTLLAHKTDAKGRSIVYLVIYVHRKKVLFNTGVKVDSELWDSKTKKIKKSHELHSDYNLIISNAYSRLTDVLVRFKLLNREITEKGLKDDYSRPSQNIDFLEFMVFEITRRRGELTQSSINSQKAHYYKLKNFKDPLTFAELTPELFEDFNRWMKNTLKNGPNTRYNTLKTIRTYINIARRRKIMQHYPLERMPVRRSQTDRVFLSQKELDSLVDLYKRRSLPCNLQFVLRHYLFGCFTGLRISDLRAITMEDIIGDFIVLVPHKTKNVTGATVKIPLTKTTKMLMKDESHLRVKGKLFNTFSEPRMRLYLKDIMVHAKIPKKANFHSARHTFATLFLSKTKNLPVLQKLLGHQNISQTMIYSHIMTNDLVAEMKVFDG